MKTWQRCLVGYWVVVGGGLGGSLALAETIERCGPYYRYADMEFMRGNVNQGCLGVRWPNTGLPLGYTLSPTPPDAEVDFIEEHATVCFPLGMFKNKIVSQGRRIPRDRVTHVPEAAAPYLKNVSTPIDEGCSRVHYTPPASAQRPDPATLARREPIYVGEPLIGAHAKTDITTHFMVGRTLLTLWGINGVPWRDRVSPLASGAAELHCRAADVGGHVCRSDGRDVALELLARGYARVKPGVVYQPYLDAQAMAKKQKAGVWRTAVNVECRRVERELTRAQQRPIADAAIQQRLLDRLKTLRDAACSE